MISRDESYITISNVNFKYSQLHASPVDVGDLTGYKSGYAGIQEIAASEPSAEHFLSRVVATHSGVIVLNTD